MLIKVERTILFKKIEERIILVVWYKRSCNIAGGPPPQAWIDEKRKRLKESLWTVQWIESQTMRRVNLIIGTFSGHFIWLFGPGSCLRNEMQSLKLKLSSSHFFMSRRKFWQVACWLYGIKLHNQKSCFLSIS